MSATVRLSSKLPKDEDTNGLDALAAHLIDHPAEIRLAIVWYDASKVVHETDEDVEVPTARIRRIEPVNGADAETLRKLAGKAFETRTGRKQLPFPPAGES